MYVFEMIIKSTHGLGFFILTFFQKLQSLTIYVFITITNVSFLFRICNYTTLSMDYVHRLNKL